MPSIADILLAKGNAYAQADVARGNIYADLIKNLSSLPGQAIQQQRAYEQDQLKQQALQSQLANQAQERQLNQFRLGAAQREQQQTDLLNTILSDKSVYNDDGTPNTEGIIARAQQHGGVDIPKLYATLDSLKESRLKILNEQARLNDAYGEARARQAVGLETIANPDTFLGAFHTAVTDLANNGALPRDRANQLLTVNDEAAARQELQQWKAGTVAGTPKIEKYGAEDYPVSVIGGRASVAPGFTPTKKKPTEWESVLADSGGDVSKALSRMHPEPTGGLGEQMRARYIAIRTMQQNKEDVSPQDLNWAANYEKEKGLTATTTFNLNQPGKEDQRRTQSYDASVKELDALHKPIADRADRLSRLQDSLNQRTPQADALLAPELLTAMAGGQGSGVRMSEAEMARIVGGRSNWETLKATLNKWSLDPSKALSVTDAQRDQMRALVKALGERTQQQLTYLNEARRSLVDAPDANAHRKIMADTQQRLDSLLNPTGAPAGTTQTPVFNGPPNDPGNVRDVLNKMQGK